MAKPKKRYAPKTSKHFASTKAYENLSYILHNTDSVKEAAQKIGVSRSTIYRWVKYGVSQKAQSDPVISKKINRTAGAYRSYRSRYFGEKPLKESRPFYYYRTHGGVRTKYWNVVGASYEQMLEIVMLECMRSIYSGFYFQLKFDTPFSGFWDGDNAQFYSQDGTDLKAPDGSIIPLRNRQRLRDSTSFVTVNAKSPYMNTKLIPLNDGDCHPDRFENNLYKFFNMNSFTINEIRFNERRTYGGKQLNIFDEYDY
jgi:hypothetical protein